MVHVVVVGGAGSIGRCIVERLAAEQKHKVTVWTRRQPSDFNVPNVLTVQVVDYSDHAMLVEKLQGVNTVLAFLNPSSDREGQNEIALIDACVEAKVKRFAPSEWAGKARSDIAFYTGKVRVKDHLEKVNNNGQILEYGYFLPGFLADYLAHPCPPNGHMKTWPLFFDLLKAKVIVVEDGTAPMVFTAVDDLSKIVALAIDSEDPWSVKGGVVGNRTNWNEVVQIAERVTCRKFNVQSLKIADLKAGIFAPDWIPRFYEGMPDDAVQKMVVPYLHDLAIGIHAGVMDPDPDWNQRFPDHKFITIEEMLTGAWDRMKAQGLVAEQASGTDSS